MIPLPPDLFQAVLSLGFFSAPHRSQPSQREALNQLRQAVAGASVQRVVDALHLVAREFRRDINGRHIPDRINYTTRTATRLIEEIEGAARQGRAA